VRPHRVRYGLGALCLLAATTLSLSIPAVVKRAIEALQHDAATAPIGRWAALILLLAVANGAARLGSRFAVIGAAQRVEWALRNDLYASLQSQPPRFYTAHRTGDLMTRASSDVAAVKSLVGFGTVSLVQTTFAFAGALAFMLALDPWLTMWAMAPFPVMIVLAKRFNAQVHERADAAQAELGALGAQVQEHLAGMSVVRAYTMERRATEDFARTNRTYLERSLALGRVEALFSPLMGLIAGVGTLIVVWVGGKDVVEGHLTLGALVAFNGYLAYLAWPTIALGYTLSIVRRGLTSMARIQEIVAPPDDDGSTAPVFGAAPGLRFSGVTFAYDGRAPVLHGVSFQVGPGECVAVVGATGSGKSTLGALLARLWEPPPGTVLIGGEDVTGLSRRALRGVLGYVPQESFLFSRSVLDNVTLERPGLELAHARAAGAVAGIDEEIAGFPEGWATVVGERGLTLSGGQRQRVALARALVGRPSVLVLDDVFASVDAAKGEEMLRALREACTGVTVLLMTHRLRAAQVADRIVVLADGRVVESGTHDALMRAGGTYARLWRFQQLEEEIARA
jgi:ATP-binding cassette subfamily B multidrug efflux pump